MKFIICLITCLATALSVLYSQTKKEFLAEYKKGKIINCSTEKKRTEYYLEKSKRGCNKQLNFDIKTIDTLIVFLNDSLRLEDVIIDPALANYNGQAVIGGMCHNEGKKVTIFLKNRKEYLEFKIKEKFYFVNVYYSNRSHNWQLKYTNNMPSY